MIKSPRQIELLAPAGNADIAIEAVKHGADAVYIGAESFGARSAAGNSLSDIARAVDFAHRYLAKIYVTVNTIIYDNELSAVERLIRNLYRVGVDALIVQDMGVLRLDIPPIALHASTQCDIRTPEKARFLQDVGFSQLVLPREFTADEIRKVYEVVDVPLESFVHGALCVSYSGDCHASAVVTGRSANRGECAQICRLPYDLYDGAGNCVEHGRHLLSLRDMNRSDMLSVMLESGVSSFKIEGRLKGMPYVKNVVAYYRRALDSVIESSGGLYKRSSAGNSDIFFTPSLDKSFNRGFTHYFLDSAKTKESIASIYTPKSQGERVGIVKSVKDGKVIARIDKQLSNGDGLAFFNKNHNLSGFRLNKIDGSVLFPAVKVDVAPGDILYRNSDRMFEDMLSGQSAVRTIGVDMTLRIVGGSLVIDVVDERGCSVTSSVHCGEFDLSRTSQAERRKDVLSKLGGTVYRVRNIDDRCGDAFVPSSVLASLRRRAISILDADNASCYVRELRRPEDRDAVCPYGPHLSYHDNVSNRLAAGFYHDHGVVSIDDAVEVSGCGRNSPIVVMTTRYCIRRELGACLKNGGESRLKGPLSIKSGFKEFDLEFDCGKCRMRVVRKCCK